MAATANGLTEDEVQAPTGVIRPDRSTPVGDSDASPEPLAPQEEGATVAPEQNEPSVVTIVDAPAIVPTAEPPVTETLATVVDADEIENFTARRKRLKARRKKERRSCRWTALILVLFAFNVALVGASSEVVRFLPQRPTRQPASPEIREYANFKRKRLSTLVIEGTIVSISGKPTEVPQLRFAARDASGQEVYTWSALPSRSILGPGEKLDFRSRLVSPPPNATDVMVRFFTPQDSVASAK